MDTDKVTETIIGCAMKVSNTLGVGFLEKVYENALAIELRKAGLTAEQQKPILVRYDGAVVGDYVADIVVNDSILLELKAAKFIDPIHQAQLLNYYEGHNDQGWSDTEFRHVPPWRQENGVMK